MIEYNAQTNEMKKIPFPNNKYLTLAYISHLTNFNINCIVLIPPFKKGGDGFFQIGAQSGGWTFSVKRGGEL